MTVQKIPFLPMSAISLFEEKQVRRAWNASEEKWVFAIVDVIAILTAGPNPQVDWRVMKKRLTDEGNETVTNGNGLKMTAADGKQRLTDVASRSVGILPTCTSISARQSVLKIPGNARKALETQSGHKISTAENFQALTESKKRIIRRKS